MSIDTIDSALDFLPEATPKAAAKRPALFATLATAISAVRDGMLAAWHYEELTARGVPHDKAIRHVFDKHFA